MTGQEFQPDAAAGWQRQDAAIPFMQHVGPTWFRQDGDQVDYGFVARSAVHGNLYGRLHGGMIAAFADYALGHALWLWSGGAAPHVTVQLGVEFMAPGAIGAWISCRSRLLRRTRSLAFMQGDILSDGALIASARGVWKSIGNRG